MIAKRVIKHQQLQLAMKQAFLVGGWGGFPRILARRCDTSAGLQGECGPRAGKGGDSAHAGGQHPAARASDWSI